MANYTFKKKKKNPTIENDYPLLMEKIKSKYIDLTRQKTLLREETRDAKVKAKNKKHNKTIKLMMSKYSPVRYTTLTLE